MTTIKYKDSKFRVIGQEIDTDWLEDSHENRKILLIILRWLRDKHGQPIFTFQELAEIIESENRQAASKYIERFRRLGEDLKATLENDPHARVDKQLRKTLVELIKQEPLASQDQIAELASQKLGRSVSRTAVQYALSNISYAEVRPKIINSLEKGEYHYKEKYLIEHLSQALIENKSEGIIPQRLRRKLETSKVEVSHKQQIKIDEQIENVFDNKSDKKLSEIWQTAQGWYLWVFILYYHGLSTFTIGKLLGINKSTVSRWLTSVSFWAEPWISKENKVNFSGQVAVDEKWVKIGNCYWFLFAAVDCITGYPLYVAFYPQNNLDYCTLFLAELKNRGYTPKIIITDGWNAYPTAIKRVFPKALHLLCVFHALHSVFRRLRKNKIFDKELSSMIGKIFRTFYKRTIERRIKKLRMALGEKLIQPVLGGLLAKLPTLFKSVGNSRPRTSNAVEHFFAKFNRFYQLKGPFVDEKSAQKHLHLFLLGYLFSIANNGQASPIEKAGIDVEQIPFYHLINQPNVIALKHRMAQQYQLKA